MAQELEGPTNLRLKPSQVERVPVLSRDAQTQWNMNFLAKDL
jgi:hypothetical protein